MLSREMHGIFLERIRREESTGFVDYLTISSLPAVLRQICQEHRGSSKLNFYNNMRLSDYSCEGYLDGLEVVCCDYRELVDKYRDSPDVVFLIDPPHGDGHQHIQDGLETYGLSGCPAGTERTPFRLFHFRQIPHTGFLSVDGGTSGNLSNPPFKGGQHVHPPRPE